MKKTSIIAIGALVVAGLFLSSVVLAGNGVGNNDKNGFQVNGKHYNLNIIGAKNASEVGNNKIVGESMGHTMFVDLYGKTKIIMTQDPDGEFEVVDRSGVGEKPAKTEFNIALGHYNVYARALGKPGGKANISAYGDFGDFTDEFGDSIILLGYVNINRSTRKPTSVNINELFYVDVTLYDTEGNIVGVYEDYWVFDIDELIEYYWDYNNKGLKLLQVRFYECKLINPEDEELYNSPADYPKDYCRDKYGDPIVSRKNGDVQTD